MSFSEPNETQAKTASAWMLITSSIILLFMVLYKILPISTPSFVPSFITGALKSVMGENSIYHGILYLFLFVLVFSSAILGFFYKED